MATPASTPTACRLVTPYECSCGGLDVDPLLPSVRINYLLDVHEFGVERAGQIQMAREQLLVRMGDVRAVK